MNERRNFLSALLLTPFAWLFGRDSSRAAPVVLQSETVELVAEPLKPHTTKLRIFKLGSLEHRIYPTKEAINKLSGLIQEWGGEGNLELIWGPELEVVEFEVTPSDKNYTVRVTEDGGFELVEL